MFVMPQNVIPVDGVVNRLRHWSAAFIISLLVNAAFFYLLTVIILTNHETQQVKKYLPMVLTQTAVVQAVEKPTQQAVTQPPKPRIEPQTKPKPKIKPLKKKENKLPLPPKPVPKPLDPVVEDKLLPNRQKVEKLVDEAIRAPSTVIEVDRMPVPLFRLTRQPGGNVGKPQYPEAAKALGREPEVKASVLVDVDGKVIEVDIVKSGGEEFDQAVKDWLIKQHLSPGYVDDTPVVSKIIVSYQFILR